MQFGSRFLLLKFVAWWNDVCGYVSSSHKWPSPWQLVCILIMTIPEITVFIDVNAHAFSPSGIMKQLCIAVKAYLQNCPDVIWLNNSCTACYGIDQSSQFLLQTLFCHPAA